MTFVPRSTLPTLLLTCLYAQAQDSQATLPTAPQPSAATRPIPASVSYTGNAGVFCGAGASTSPAATKPTFGCGAGFTFVPVPVFFEVGVLAPQANRSYLSGYFSADVSIPLASTHGRYLPFLLAGYSRLFETGHALDYGLALALPRFHDKQDGDSMRFELRDYWTFANPTQHNIVLRIGWLGPFTD